MTVKSIDNDTLLTVTMQREFWTGASQQEGKPAKVVPVLERQIIDPHDLLHYQMLGGFSGTSDPTPAAPDLRFTNGRSPLTDPSYGEQEIEFCWFQIHEVDGQPATPADMLAIGDLLDIAFPEGQDLEARRRDQADAAFEEADFGDVTVEAHNGWEVEGDRWTKLAFMDVGGEETVKMYFGVEFTPGTAGLVHLPEFEVPERIENLAGPDF